MLGGNRTIMPWQSQGGNSTVVHSGMLQAFNWSIDKLTIYCIISPVFNCTLRKRWQDILLAGNIAPGCTMLNAKQKGKQSIPYLALTSYANAMAGLCFVPLFRSLWHRVKKSLVPCMKPWAEARNNNEYKGYQTVPIQGCDDQVRVNPWVHGWVWWMLTLEHMLDFF